MQNAELNVWKTEWMTAIYYYFQTSVGFIVCFLLFV